METRNHKIIYSNTNKCLDHKFNFTFNIRKILFMPLILSKLNPMSESKVVPTLDLIQIVPSVFRRKDLASNPDSNKRTT